MKLHILTLSSAICCTASSASVSADKNLRKQDKVDHEDVVRKLHEMAAKMEEQSAKIEEQSLKLKAFEEMMSVDQHRALGGAGPNQVLACYEGYENLGQLFTPRVYTATYIEDCGEEFEIGAYNIGYNTEIVPLGVIHSPPSHGVQVDVSLASGTLMWGLSDQDPGTLYNELQAGVQAVSVSFVETCRDATGAEAPEYCESGPDVQYANPPVAIFDSKLKITSEVSGGKFEFDFDLVASSHSFKFLAKGLAPNRKYVVSAKFYFFAIAASLNLEDYFSLLGVGIWVGARTVTSQVVKMDLETCDLEADAYPGLEDALFTIADDFFGGCNIFEP